VLFADVRGYTSLTERLSPAEVPAVVNRFYATASGALLSNGGLLAQIAGDEVMALFVPGLAGREYRRRAVDGARDLLAAVETLDVGVGIATGEQFVGNVGGGGYKDFTAVGDVTNTAARLVSTAQAREIMVDAETYAAVADVYPRAARRVLELKGKAEPVEAYALDAPGP
jgi:adenylate cyclase